MAFIPPQHHQYCSDHMFSGELICQLPTTTPMILSDSTSANNNGRVQLNMMPIMDAAAAISTFPHHHHHHHNPLLGEVSDHPPAAIIPPCGIIGPREFSRTPRAGYDHLFESGDECNNNNNNGLLLDSNFWSLYPAMRPPPSSYNIEGIQLQGEALSPKLKEQPAMKIGRYSEEERKDRILRYLKKRNQRNFNKTIKYACRKTLADKRVRVRGRFAKNNEICGGDDNDDIVIKSNDNNNFHQTKDLYYHHPYPFQQAKLDEEEEWLEEAITSLMYIGGSYDTQFVNFS